MLGAVCAVMHRQDEKTLLPWLLLALFGFSHGLNEWLDMLAITIGPGKVPVAVQLALTAFSFLFLTEFGRQGLSRTGAVPFGPWIYLPLVGVCGACAMGGDSESYAAVRYCFGLVGGVMAAMALWQKAKVKNDSLLASAAVIMGLYSMAAGIIVPKSGFFPASELNQSTFLEITGIPIQLIRALLAVICTSLIWNFHQKKRNEILQKELQTGAEHPGLLLTIVIIALLIIGWVGTQLLGQEAMEEVRRDSLQATRTASAAIDSERIKRVLTIPDPYGTDYQRLHEQLTSIQRVNPCFKVIRLVLVKNHTATIIVDSAGSDHQGHSGFGTRYLNPPQELFSITDKSRTAGPYREADGVYLAALSPLLDRSGQQVAILSALLSSGNWQQVEARYRLVAIMATLVFSALVTIFFIIRQRMIESSRMLAVSQRRLEEARLQKQYELEAVNRSLEAAVTLRTIKLTESNRELQQFAYIASHDLQEPLRTINSFIQLLARRYRGKLDQDADEFIEFITDGVKRMQQLIGDLLAYSRVESKGRPFQALSGNRIMEMVLQNLSHAIQESNAEISHDQLPQLFGDESQLVQLFQNLISNALKFRGTERPRIHVACINQGDHWEISISDNGIGIEERFHQKIFDIFQRLHGREQYAGTGIGLSICKKIVERHGGHITVQSTPGEGSTFVFTLQKNTVEDL